MSTYGKKTARVTLKVTPAQLRRIKADAKEEGFTVSLYVRKKLFSKKERGTK